MKYLIYAAVFCYVLYAATAMAQGYTTLPNGQVVFTPQPSDFQSQQFYAPQGGAPVGYGIKSGDVQLYIPYRGGPSYVLQDDQ